MKIELKEVTVRELADGYRDNQEGGVVAYSGRLDVRPPYQREFVYKDKQRNAVIDTVMKGFPLNVMYWAVRDDGTFEVIDGQQRTISICQYVDGDFSIGDEHGEPRYFRNLMEAKDRFLDYRLTVYLCSGTQEEKLEWFRTINIAGEELTEQELRNACYSGPWVSDAKRFFSRRNCPAQGLASDYLTGSAIRQDYLETAIDWISDGKINHYMAVHQHEPNADVLVAHFKRVVEWVGRMFPFKRKEMKGQAWGALYRQFGDLVRDPLELEAKIKRLMLDDEVTNKRGIYSYLFTGDERTLNLRTFTESQKRAAYERQAGVCAMCGKKFDFNEMEADHIDPWHAGGKTTPENCQMLCRSCNRRKSGK